MKPNREIIARPKAGHSIREEFIRFLQEADKRQWTALGVLFGFAWADEAYEGDWVEEEMTPDELRVRVRALEEHGHGAIGEDDLFITVKATGIQFTFCHENDIHIQAHCNERYLSEKADEFRSLGWEILDRTKPGDPNESS